MKLFLVGFPKSGTSTIHEALQCSGLRSAHWKCAEGFVGEIIYDNFYRGRPPFASLEAYDAITQADVCLPEEGINLWPNLDFSILAWIRQAHPDCLFLLNWRDPASVASSISRWGDLQNRLAACDIPGLPRGYGIRTTHLIRWIEGHYEAVRVLFKDSNFLELDIAAPDAAEKLSGALGVPLAWWGRANVNSPKTQEPPGEVA